MSIVLQRIYDEEKQIGGHRILIDRVWPRGISKEDADLEEWVKDVAPSSSLRKWFNHDPNKFESFKEAYKDEINQDAEKQEKLNELKEMATDERLVLLFGAKDEQHNHAVVLKEMLQD